MEESRNDLQSRIGSLKGKQGAVSAATGVGMAGAANAAGEDAVDYSNRVLDATHGAYVDAKRIVAKTKALERRSALDAHETRVLEEATEQHEEAARKHLENAHSTEGEINKIRAQMRLAMKATRRTVAFNAIASHAIAHDASLVAQVVHHVLNLRHRTYSLLHHESHDIHKIRALTTKVEGAVKVEQTAAGAARKRASASATAAATSAKTAARWLHSAMVAAHASSHSAATSAHAAASAVRHNAVALKASIAAVDEARQAGVEYGYSSDWARRERAVGYQGEAQGEAGYRGGGGGGAGGEGSSAVQGALGPLTHRSSPSRQPPPSSPPSPSSSCRGMSGVRRRVLAFRG